MLVIVLTAVLANPRYVYLPPFYPAPAPWPIAIVLRQPFTQPPRPFSAAQARSFHGLRRVHGFSRATVTVRFKLKR